MNSLNIQTGVTKGGIVWDNIWPQAYHPLFVLQTCDSWILMAASVVYKGFCEYDN